MSAKDGPHVPEPWQPQFGAISTRSRQRCLHSLASRDHRPEPQAFSSPHYGHGPAWPHRAGYSWLTALSQSQHITNFNAQAPSAILTQQQVLSPTLLSLISTWWWHDGECFHPPPPACLTATPPTPPLSLQHNHISHPCHFVDNSVISGDIVVSNSVWGSMWNSVGSSVGI